MLRHWKGASVSPSCTDSMAPSPRKCRSEMVAVSGCLLLCVVVFRPVLSRGCNDNTGRNLDNSWYTKDGEELPIMVLMPMNESARMSSISQGIDPAVQLAIQHIRESRLYSFSLIPKIYDTEVTRRVVFNKILLCLRSRLDDMYVAPLRNPRPYAHSHSSVCAILFMWTWDWDAWILNIRIAMPAPFCVKVAYELSPTPRHHMIVKWERHLQSYKISEINQVAEDGKTEESLSRLQRPADRVPASCTRQSFYIICAALTISSLKRYIYKQHRIKYVKDINTLALR